MVVHALTTSYEIGECLHQQWEHGLEIDAIGRDDQRGGRNVLQYR